MTNDETSDVAYEPNEYEQVVIDDNRAYLVRGDDTGEFMNASERLEYLSHHLPDQWICDNDDDLTEIFEVVKQMAYLTTLYDQGTFQEFCDYMLHVNVNDTQQKNNFDWNSPEVMNYVLKAPGKKLPTQRQFLAHMLEELLELHTFLERTYTEISFGCFEQFVCECFDRSSSNVVLP